MKAILVIDVDEIENCDAEVCVYKNDIPYQGFSRIKLKPMPQKKDGDFVWVDIDTCDESYIHGWNDCIDDILGGEEE